MATTSGTINSQTYDVISLIEMASKRCGKLPGSLSSEEFTDSTNELQMMLNALIQEGCPLWTVDKQIYGLNLYQNLIQFSPGTVDLSNVLYRFNNLPSGGIASASSGNADNAFNYDDLTIACTQTAPNGNISYDFTVQTVIVTVGLLINATALLNPVYEYSNDGITWTTVIAAAAASSSYVKGQWYWQDIAAPQTGLQFRVRETSGGTLDVLKVVFGTAANEIILSEINKDDYQNLPFKNQTGRPLQFWYDRQITPQAWVWPASAYTFNSVVVWRRRELQDVGAPTDILEFPNRWLDTIVAGLAARMIYILTSVDLANRGPLLEMKAKEAKALTWTEERPTGPLYMGVNISGYTQQGGSGYRGGY